MSAILGTVIFIGDVYSAGRSLLEKEKDFTGMGEALF